MNKSTILLIMAFVLLIAGLIVGIIGSDKIVIGETPCVDGYYQVNLEGIMCEDTKDVWFGIGWGWGFLMIIPGVLVTIIALRELSNEIINS